MGDLSRKIDVEKLLSFSDDLLRILKDKKDGNYSTACMSDSKSLLSSCDSDFNEVKRSLEEYQKKIAACKQKTEEAKSTIVADAELAFLEEEMEEQTRREKLLQEDLRNLADEISDLERKGNFIEEEKLVQKKLKLDELRAQRKLSMYASVAKIIPNMDNDSAVPGHIVDRDRKVHQKFEFLLTKNEDSFDTCNSIWQMIGMRRNQIFG